MEDVGEPYRLNIQFHFPHSYISFFEDHSYIKRDSRAKFCSVIGQTTSLPYVRKDIYIRMIRYAAMEDVGEPYRLNIQFHFPHSYISFFEDHNLHFIYYFINQHHNKVIALKIDKNCC